MILRTNNNLKTNTMIHNGFGNDYDNINLDNDVLEQAKGLHSLFTSGYASPAPGDPNNNGLREFIGGFVEFNLYIMLYLALIATMVGVALIGGCIMKCFITVNSNTKKDSKEVDLEQQEQIMKSFYKPTAPIN